VDKDCTACHLPHASEQKMMLKTDTTDLCLDCHSQIRELIATAVTKHDAVSTGEACHNCHDPHGSDFTSLLLNNMVAVCLTCHDRKIELEGGQTLENMAAVLASGKSLHGPIAEDNCVACHQIHGGSNFRLLVKAYPPEFYAPFQEKRYALCFVCHEGDLVRDAKTTSLTDFRNGDVNMHYLHVNKKTKGRTCRACHETHASDKAKHIRDAVPFGSGGWELPINFEKTETGGRCSPGCHRPYAYDRVNPVSNLPATQPAIWPDENSAAAGTGNQGDEP
jgi:predicted CXXCH cytochrome family protein